MSKRNLLSNLKIVTIHDEIKLVIGDRNDYDWARDIIRQYDLTNRVGTVLLSPVHGSLQESDLAAWILEDALDVRFQIQLHKVIWPAAMRGV